MQQWIAAFCCCVIFHYEFIMKKALLIRCSVGVHSGGSLGTVTSAVIMLLVATGVHEVLSCGCALQ